MYSKRVFHLTADLSYIMYILISLRYIYSPYIFVYKTVILFSCEPYCFSFEAARFLFDQSSNTVIVF